tara:strand:+ start:11528 stop:11851 length:324 start_codon:yes stop_codon:yes gene_type:complete
MAMGSYNLGATVRIPLQVTDTGIAFTEDIDPIIHKIVKPNGQSASGFPNDMGVLDQDFATYYYDYTPDSAGDYVVIIAYYVEGVEFTVIENFTVGSSSRTAPRAESR